MLMFSVNAVVGVVGGVVIDVVVGGVAVAV